MKIDVEQALLGFQTTLLTNVLPVLGTDYLAGSTGTIGVGLNLAAQEFDRAADLLVTDNRELRALFAAASESLEDAKLTARLREAATSRDASFRISELSHNNDTLNELLIELHTHVEELPGPPAQEMEGRILKHLRASASRRSLDFPVMEAETE